MQSWFEATTPGTYHLFCSQYCGTKHSGMIGEVTVMKPEDFAAWLESGKAEGSMAANGEKLFQQFGCITCHRPDSGARGPNLEGLYGRPVRLQDNRVVVADDNYIRESILDPNAKIVSGFQPIMPTFRGVISEEGLLQIIAYIKTLSEQTGQPLNNRSTPTQIRDNEVPTIQQQMHQENQAPKPPGKKP
jgi:cytochrome c oxidase subunit 2